MKTRKYLLVRQIQQFSLTCTIKPQVFGKTTFHAEEVLNLDLRIKLRSPEYFIDNPQPFYLLVDNSEFFTPVDEDGQIEVPQVFQVDLEKIINSGEQKMRLSLKANMDMEKIDQVIDTCSLDKLVHMSMHKCKPLIVR